MKAMFAVFHLISATVAPSRPIAQMYARPLLLLGSFLIILLLLAFESHSNKSTVTAGFSERGVGVDLSLSSGDSSGSLVRDTGRNGEVRSDSAEVSEFDIGGSSLLLKRSRWLQ